MTRAGRIVGLCLVVCGLYAGGISVPAAISGTVLFVFAGFSVSRDDPIRKRERMTRIPAVALSFVAVGFVVVAVYDVFQSAYRISDITSWANWNHPLMNPENWYNNPWHEPAVWKAVFIQCCSPFISITVAVPFLRIAWGEKPENLKVKDTERPQQW